MSTRSKTTTDLKELAGRDSAGGERSEPAGRAGVPGMAFEIGGGNPVLGPRQGEPNIERQGRGPESTGRSARGWLRGWASVRAGLKEAVDASWW
jgi:hypothetical protein